MGNIQFNRQILLKIIKGAFLVFLFYTGTKALDSLRCSYELFDNNCFLYQDEVDDFDWTYSQLKQGSIFAAEGHNYAFIDGTDRKLDDAAVLYSYAQEVSSYSCLTFAYFIHGEKMGSLNVFVRDYEGNGVTRWSKSGNQGSEWHGTGIDIHVQPIVNNTLYSTVTVEGIIGKEQKGVIAIDNITLAPGQCAEGTWGEWAGWGPCSSTCGNSTRTRSLVCSDIPFIGGPYCSISEAPYTQLENCSTQPCPVVPPCPPWSAWSQCSKTCGFGKKSRNRVCNGLHATVSNNCFLTLCPINGGWSSWRTWSSCAVVNQEILRSRCRKCSNPTPQHGGTPCPGESLQSEQCRATVDEFKRKRKRCRCRRRQVPEIKNLTQEELATVMEETKKELTVDKKKTTKATRKKISARDDRKSSTAMAGVLASIMFAIPALFMVGVDLMNIPKRLNEVKRKKKITPNPGSNK